MEGITSILFVYEHRLLRYLYIPKYVRHVFAKKPHFTGIRPKGIRMSEEKPIDLYRQDFALFIEAGFIAVKQLDEIAARRLFKAAELLSPDSSAPKLGLGYIELNKMRAVEAAKIFESILAKEPEHHLAKALLGIAYLMSKDKRQQGEVLITEAKNESDDPTIQNLANVSSQWLNKDIKQAHAMPFAPAMKEQE